MKKIALLIPLLFACSTKDPIPTCTRPCCLEPKEKPCTEICPCHESHTCKKQR